MSARYGMQEAEVVMVSSSESVHELTVVLPNFLKETGKALRYHGVFKAYWDKEHGVIPTLTLRDGTHVVLDPRAMIFDETTASVAYSPRYFSLKKHATWCREWLNQHARWGTPGCEHDWSSAVEEEAVQ